MGTNRDSRAERRGTGKRGVKFKSSRGVGTRRESPDGYVPKSGSPSLDDLRRFKKS